VQKARVLTLERATSEYTSRMEERTAELAKARQRSVELQLRVASLANNFRKQAADELRDSTDKLVDLLERLRPSKDAAQRQSIVAPAAGEVVNLQVFTPGAVIGPREVLAEVVPAERKLIVEANVRPEDINYLKAGVAAINPSIQLNTFRTLDEQFARRLVSPRFNMLLVASFALVAVLMAAVGVYGVNSYAVASRTREFGVRAALGASPGQLVAGVVRRGMALASIGIVAGCVGAIAVGRLLASLLYGLPARDPLTLACAVGILTLVAAVACWVPARRASRVDPVAALRAQ